MSAVLDTTVERDESLSLAPKLQQLHGSCCTRRVEELEALSAKLRAALYDVEAELIREKSRLPEVGDFVRCPLTNFFGQVTKVSSRPYGRPWVEIIPYLTRDYVGHAPMDLYDSWELIDPPSEEDVNWPAVTSPPALPAIRFFK